jgi:hypothetical protein
MTTIYYDLTAAGTTQGTATALTVGGTYFGVSTVTSTADGVQLPTASAGDTLIVKNDDSNGTTLKIYPQTGGTVAGGATNASASLTAGSAVTYTTSNGSDWRSVASGIGVSGGLKKVVAISTTATLTATQSGALVLVTAGSAYTISLPALQAGLNYTLVQVSAASSGVTVAATSTVLHGSSLGAATILAINGSTNILFASGVSLRGDKIELLCDGTGWAVRASARAAGAFTVS